MAEYPEVKWHPNEQPQIQTALRNWQADLVGTLVYVQRADQVLLIRKKTGHGRGLLNAPGGKLEAPESAPDCARRELQEELGVTVRELAPMARLRFIDAEGPQWLGLVYCGRGLQGVPTESAEAAPHWFPQTALPLAEMWPTDAFWLPQVLAGDSLEADFLSPAASASCHRWRYRQWGASFD